jgi:hypothetical protein
MDSLTLQAHQRRKLQPEKDAEHDKLVRRCIASYCDLSTSRRDWESRYPQGVKEEALHVMTLDQLRMRG